MRLRVPFCNDCSRTLPFFGGNIEHAYAHDNELEGLATINPIQIRFYFVIYLKLSVSLKASQDRKQIAQLFQTSEDDLAIKKFVRRGLLL
jgi:hypothetical protein